MDNKSFYKTLIRITLPMMLQNLVSSSLTLLDNLMVSSLSEAALSSVGLAIQLFGVQWMMIFGFCTGCSTFYTQFWGLRDTKSIKKVIGIALSTCMALSVVFFIAAFCFPSHVISLFTKDAQVAAYGAQYLRYAAVNFLLIAAAQPFAVALRATQQTRLPMYASVVSFVSDVIFNYLLIFGHAGFPRLEVTGAAIATVIARVIELGLLLFFVFGRKNILSGKIKDYFSFDRNLLRRVYRNAAATTANETLWGAAVAIYNAAFGHMGVTAYAAYAAAVNVMDLFQNMAFSLGDTTLILIGERLGRSEKKEAQEISKKMLKTAFCFACVLAVLILLARRPILGLFGLTAEGTELAMKIVMVRALLLPMDIVNANLITGILRSGGDTRYAAVTEITLMYVIAVPVAFLCLHFGTPIYLAVALVKMEGVVKICILLRRYLSGKWINNVVDDLVSE